MMEGYLLPIRIGAAPIQRDIVNKMNPPADFKRRGRRVTGETPLRRISRALLEHFDRRLEIRSIRRRRHSNRLPLRRLPSWAGAKRAEINKNTVVVDDRA